MTKEPPWTHLQRLLLPFQMQIKPRQAFSVLSLVGGLTCVNILSGFQISASISKGNLLNFADLLYYQQG